MRRERRAHDASRTWAYLNLEGIISHLSSKESDSLSNIPPLRLQQMKQQYPNTDVAYCTAIVEISKPTVNR